MPQTSMISKAICHEVSFYDMFFGKFTLSISRLLQFFATPKGSIVISLILFALYVADFSYLRTISDSATAISLWILSVLAYFVTLFTAFLLIAIYQMRYGPRRFYVPAATVFCYVSVALFAHISVSATMGQGPPSGILGLFIKLMFVGMLCEVTFLRFIFPGIPDPRKLSHPDIPPLQAITLGDRSFPKAKINHIQAQEHYLNITGPNDTIIVRAKLGEAISQMQPAEGIQPHRSWWVAASAAPSLAKRAEKPVLILADKTVVPIARARIADVQRWLDLYGNW